MSKTAKKGLLALLLLAVLAVAAAGAYFSYSFFMKQTHKGTEPKLDASALYDPQVNVEYGVYFLSILWEEYDDETVILSAYNAGMGNVDQWLSEEEHSSDGVTLHDIPYGETEQYVKNVLESQEMYRRLYGEEFKNWR